MYLSLRVAKIKSKSPLATPYLSRLLNYGIATQPCSSQYTLVSRLRLDETPDRPYVEPSLGRPDLHSGMHLVPQISSNNGSSKMRQDTPNRNLVLTLCLTCLLPLTLMGLLFGHSVSGSRLNTSNGTSDWKWRGSKRKVPPTRRRRLSWMRW